jgi:hypothetical protein
VLAAAVSAFRRSNALASPDLGKLLIDLDPDRLDDVTPFVDV